MIRQLFNKIFVYKKQLSYFFFRGSSCHTWRLLKYFWVLLTIGLRSLVKESKMENFNNFHIEKVVFW